MQPTMRISHITNPRESKHGNHIPSNHIRSPGHRHLPYERATSEPAPPHVEGRCLLAAGLSSTMSEHKKARSDAYEPAMKSRNIRTRGRKSSIVLPSFDEVARLTTGALSERALDDFSSSRLAPLSIYPSPTATFAWPQLELASQMKHEPVLYVKYAEAQSHSDSDDCTSIGSTSRPSSSHRLSVQYPPQSSASSSASSRKRKSPEVHDRDSLRMSPLVTPSRDSRLAPPRSPSSMSISSDPGQGRMLHPSYRHQAPSEGHRSWQGNTPDSRCSSLPRSDTGSVSDDEAPSGNQTSPTSVQSQKWEDYVLQGRDSLGNVVYRCQWTLEEKGRRSICNYSSKKQLVKRHVETTHLKFKPYSCEICQKAFPQKTSLDIHRSGHTGETPHICAYNCGKAFKDPARRHRHHVEAHGYIPKQAKKKHKLDNSRYQDLSEYESIQPWPLSASGSKRG